MEMRQVGFRAVPAAVILAAVAALPAQAVTVTGIGDDGAELKAEATFAISGGDLTITLTNLATADENSEGLDTPTNTLTGLFFDIAGDPTLTTVSATVAGGSSIIQASACSPGPCTGTDVSGEWGFSQTQDFSLTGGPNAKYGIGSSGYLTLGGMGIGNFDNGGPGPNLDDPPSIDGINFGIVSSQGIYNPNGGAAGLLNEPLIRDSVVFVLSGVGDIDMSAISNVSFQYGTTFGDPRIVPVPAAVWLFGSGLLGLVGIARRRS